MQSASRKQSLIDRSVLPRHLCTVSISAVLVSFPDQYDAMFIAICTLSSYLHKSGVSNSCAYTQRCPPTSYST